MNMFAGDETLTNHSCHSCILESCHMTCSNSAFNPIQFMREWSTDTDADADKALYVYCNRRTLACFTCFSCSTLIHWQLSVGGLMKNGLPLGAHPEWIS